MGCNCPGDVGKELLVDPAVRMNTCRACPKYKRNPIVGPTCGTLAIPEYDKDGKEVAREIGLDKKEEIYELLKKGI